MPALSVKFYLESKVKGNDQKPLPIFLYVRHNGRTLKVFTDRKCYRAAWDPEKGRANSRRYRNATELNGFLSELEEEATNLYNYNSRKGLETNKMSLLKLIQKISGLQTNDQDFLSFAADYISKSTLTASSKQVYNSTVEKLREFSIIKKKPVLFGDIDLNFYDDFTTWLWDKKDLGDNTVGKHIKNIKALMNQAFERDLHSNLHYKKKGFQVLRRSSDSIYLNETELKKLIDLDLSNNDRLQKVRDAFIVACWTGLRFSDLVRISKDKFIKEDGIQLFKIETEKTGEIVKVPVSPLIIPILEKYQFNIPVITNQKMNAYLKEIGKLKAAGLDYDVELTEIKAGKKKREKFKKYDLITTHTARRSFASNLYLQGVPSRSIMAITGHRTEKSFMEYIKLSNMEKIREVDALFKKIHDPKLKVA